MHYADSKIYKKTLGFFCSTATNVEIELPVPSDASNPNVRTSMGSASYAPESDSLIWKIKSFPGGKVIAWTTLAFLVLRLLSY